MRRCDGRLAQLVRAPALQAGGRRFEPCTAHQVCLGNPKEMSEFSQIAGLLLSIISSDFSRIRPEFVSSSVRTKRVSGLRRNLLQSTMFAQKRQLFSADRMGGSLIIRVAGETAVFSVDAGFR